MFFFNKRKPPLNFEKAQPIDVIGDGYIMLKNGYISCAIEITWMGIFYMDEVEIEKYIMVPFKFFFKNLPAGTCVHFQNVYEPSDMIVEEQSQDYLDRTQRQMFQQDSFTSHRSFLFISFPAAYSCADFVVYNDESFRRIGKANNSSNTKEVDLGKLIKKVKTFASQLEKTGMIKAEFLHEEALYRYAKEYISLSLINPNKAGQIQHNPTYLNIGGKYASFLSLKNNPDIDVSEIAYPDHSTDYSEIISNFLPASFVNSLCLGLDCKHITNLSFIVHDKNSFSKKLKKHIKDFAGVGERFDNNLQKYAFLNGFIENIDGDPNETYVTYSLNVMVYGENEKEWLNGKDLAEGAFTKLNMECIEENFANFDYFLSNMAGNGYATPRQHLGKLAHVCCLFPYETNGIFSSKGMPISTKTGRPTFLDLLSKRTTIGNVKVSKTNYNMLISGKTGGGKSNFMGYLIRYFWNMGSHIVLLDKGDSFGRLVKFLRGKLYTYTDEQPLSFNPFLLAQDEEGKYIYSKNELDFLVPLLISAIYEHFDTASLNKIKDLLTDELIKEYYHRINSRKIKKAVGFNSFYEFIEDFEMEVTRETDPKLQRIHHQFPFEKILIAFKKFYRGGIYEDLFNANANMNILKDRFVVFELDKIQEDPYLFRIVAICISKLVNAKFKHPLLDGAMKFFFIDEGTFILRDFMVEVTAGLYQTARKHHAGICFADQTFDKLAATGVANRIAGNTDTVILLEQNFTEDTETHLKRYLNFTNNTIRKVRAIDNSGDWREGIIKINDAVFNFRLEFSKEYYLALNTDRDERMSKINKRIMEYFEEVGSLEYAIEQIKEEENV